MDMEDFFSVAVPGIGRQMAKRRGERESKAAAATKRDDEISKENADRERQATNDRMDFTSMTGYDPGAIERGNASLSTRDAANEAAEAGRPFDIDEARGANQSDINDAMALRKQMATRARSGVPVDDLAELNAAIKTNEDKKFKRTEADEVELHDLRTQRAVRIGMPPPAARKETKVVPKEPGPWSKLGSALLDRVTRPATAAPDKKSSFDWRSLDK